IGERKRAFAIAERNSAGLLHLLEHAGAHSDSRRLLRMGAEPSAGDHRGDGEQTNGRGRACALTTRRRLSSTAGRDTRQRAAALPAARALAVNRAPISEALL